MFSSFKFSSQLLIKHFCKNLYIINSLNANDENFYHYSFVALLQMRATSAVLNRLLLIIYIVLYYIEQVFQIQAHKRAIMSSGKDAIAQKGGGECSSEISKNYNAKLQYS